MYGSRGVPEGRRDNRRIDPAGSPDVGLGRVNGMGRGRDLVRRRAVGLFVLATLCATWAAGAAHAGAAECPNAAFRTGPGAELPECRAYEMVSPPDKGGNDVRRKQTTARSSVSGDAITFDTAGAFPEAEAKGAQIYPRYLMKRTPTGWVGGSVDSPQDSQLFTGGFNWYLEQIDPAFFTPELTATGELNYGGELVPSEEVPGAILLWRHDLGDDSYQLVTRSENEPILPTFATFYIPYWVTSTADDGKILFETNSNLTADAEGTATKLYEWDHGTVRLAGILPNGEAPLEGSVAGGDIGLGGAMNFAQIRGDATLSTDGSHVIFSTLPLETRQLYLRTDNGRPDAKTVRVSESEASPPDPTSLAAEFLGASKDGERIVFASGEKLTDDDPSPSSEAPSSRNIYLFTNGSDPEAEPNLQLVSKDLEPADGEAAEALGVVGVSDDGSRIYFTAKGALVPGVPVDPKVTKRTQLYLWEGGAVRYVAQLGDGSEEGSINWSTGWSGNFPPRPSRVTPDGRFLLFESSNRLTSYDSHGAGELYVYDADRGTTVCASCDPNGDPPTGPIVTGGFQPSISATRYEPRLMVDRGDRVQVFFGTPDPLTAGDVNGRYDVYGFDSSTGSIVRYSSGRGSSDSYFMDASPDGRNVFITTRDQLSGWDKDELMDLYDARVDGGLPGPPAPEAPCVAEACQGGAAPPPQATPAASAAIVAPGNRKATPKKPSKCKAQKGKSKGKGCGKKKAQKQKKRGSRHKGQARKAAQNGRAGR